MKSITSRFVMLIATAAVAPLVIYGVVSMRQLRSGTEESVTKGNLGHRDAGGRADQSVRREQPARPAIHRAGASHCRPRTMAAVPHPERHRPGLSRVPRALDLRCDGTAARHEPLRPADGHRFPIAPRPPAATSTSRRSSRTTTALPTTTIAVRMEPSDAGIRTGSSASSRSKSCGGWSIRSRSASPAAPRCFSESGRLIAHGNADKKRLVASAKGDSRIEQTAAAIAGEVRRPSKSTTTTRRARKSSRSAR